MAKKWIQAVGTFNRADHSGEFVAVQPARESNMLRAQSASGLLETISTGQASSVLGELSPHLAAQLCNQLPSHIVTELLGLQRSPTADAILEEMTPEEAASARKLAQYADDVAGGLMATEYLSVTATSSIAQVIAKLTTGADRYRDFDVQYVYVTDERGRLVGVLPLREIVLSKPDRSVRTVMISSPLSLLDSAGLEEVESFFDKHSFFGVPIVDADQQLIGVVRRSSIEQVRANQADDRYRKSQGLVAEELRSMPTLLRSRRRLAWLSANVVLNVIAASVIVYFEETIQRVIALAVFLPLISDMSGCSGGQAVAVTMREVSLGLAKPSDYLRILGKEASVGLINGFCLGCLVGLGGLLIYGNPWLGLVVGAALCINTVIAVAIGGCIPLLLKRFKFDPAVASGPLLTTITDMCGFFIVLGLATAFLSRLVHE